MLKGIKEPTDIYQLFAKGEQNIPSNLNEYDRALCQFERGELTESLLGLAQMQLESPGDPVTEFLFKLVVEEKRKSLARRGLRSTDLPTSIGVKPGRKLLLQNQSINFD